MNRIQNIIYNNIFYIALYCSITSIIFYIAALFSKTLPEKLLDVLSVFSVSTIDLTYFQLDFFTFSYYITDTGTITRSALTPLFIILFFIGTLLYSVSKKKEHRIFNFCFSLLFMASLTSIIDNTIGLILGREFYSYPLLAFYIFKSIIIVFISFVYLQKCYQQKQLVLLEGEGVRVFLNNSGDVSVLKHERASKWQRFVHYIIDSFLIIMLFSKYTFFMPRAFMIELTAMFGDRFYGFILYFIASTIYYVLFETLFKTTPGKYLMNTSVINYKEGKISFGQIVARTLSRRIPFEAFSFFGAVGLHDRLSSTTVAKQQSDKTYENGAKFILALFGLFVLLIAIMNFSNIF
ncbi:RDD family protein [Kordia antarctica]|nr:RDD family protein [Kordia antarctica]